MQAYEDMKKKLKAITFYFALCFYRKKKIEANELMAYIGVLDIMDSIPSYPLSQVYEASFGTKKENK